MTRPSLLAPFLAVVLLGGVCLPALGDEDMTPRPHRVFTEKPRIEDYSDYNTFLVDIMEYRRQKEERQRSTPATGAAKPVAASAGPRPETLDEAIARARTHPLQQAADSDDPERYGRSTSASFPLAPMAGGDLSDNEISGSLGDLNAAAPEGYKAPGAELATDSELSDDPTHASAARQTKTQKELDEPFIPSYDPGSRLVIDSLGHEFIAPLVVPDDFSYTYIRRFDVEVSTFQN